MVKYADTTLKSLTKEQLIQIIRSLESSIDALSERNDRQFELLMKHDLKLSEQEKENE